LLRAVYLTLAGVGKKTGVSPKMHQGPHSKAFSPDTPGSSVRRFRNSVLTWDDGLGKIL